MITEECQITLNTGLRGVTIASTRISDVDGDAGRLIYRGYRIEDLAEQSTFEETIYLLLYEKLPSRSELKQFKERLSREREIPAEIIATLRNCPSDSLPMDILQAGVALLANHDPDIQISGQDASDRIAIRLIARMATLVAAWHQIRNGQSPVPPNSKLDHAANFLYMLSGKIPDPETARFMDICLVLHAEHSFNASTFAAREVASTRAHMYASVSAAVGSLSGELHGGANARVMQMLLKIGDVNRVASYIQEELDAGRRIMGLGHAVYNVDDPRAKILEPISRILGDKTDNPLWHTLSVALKDQTCAAFKQRKGIDIPVNVDFYSASVYYYMKIPVDLFTPVFAISRIAGWAAHVIEEQFGGASSKPVLYRPESEYIGDYCGPDVCTLTPIESR
ncbi:MAG: citrate/2-methylcitrate synthase [Desulfatirhabdiaceae bacterium]